MTAAPMTSVGLRSPRGPVGILGSPWIQGYYAFAVYGGKNCTVGVKVPLGCMVKASWDCSSDGARGHFPPPPSNGNRN
jgi:hypothetical protein